MNTTNETVTAPGSSPPGLSLQLNVEEIRNELALAPPTVGVPGEPEIDPELERQAQQYADLLANLDPKNADAHDEATAAVEEMGRSLQQEAAHRSQMLQQPIKELSEHGTEGSPVANALIDLNSFVDCNTKFVTC